MRVACAVCRQPHHHQRPRPRTSASPPRCGSAGGAAPPTGNDAGADALKQLADEAVQIARVSPVQREYVPTLGPLTTPRRAASPPRPRTSISTARAKALEAVLAACRTAKVTGAGFHTATRVGHRRGHRQRQPPLFPLQRGAASASPPAAPTAPARATYAGDHFDLARLDAQHIAEQAVGKAVRSRQPKPIEPGVYPVILEPQAVADLIGFLTGSLDARTADEGRSAFSGKDGKTRRRRDVVQRAAEPLQRSDAPGLPAAPAPSRAFRRRGCRSIKAGVLENLEYSRFWAQEQQARADARTGELHPREHAAAGVDRRHDQGHGARPADLAVLVRAPRSIRARSC